MCPRYVLDIRNNGGGLFPAGVEVARMLLKDGDIVLIADSQGVRDSYSAINSAVEDSAPLSVLVNRGTASASEVGIQFHADPSLLSILDNDFQSKVTNQASTGPSKDLRL